MTGLAVLLFDAATSSCTGKNISYHFIHDSHIYISRAPLVLGQWAYISQYLMDRGRRKENNIIDSVWIENDQDTPLNKMSLCFTLTMKSDNNTKDNCLFFFSDLYSYFFLIGRACPHLDIIINWKSKEHIEKGSAAACLSVSFYSIDAITLLVRKSWNIPQFN